MIENESQKLDYMGRIPAIGWNAGKGRDCQTVPSALGSDSAAGGCGRENDLHRAVLEDVGEIFGIEGDSRYRAFALGIESRDAGKGTSLIFI